MGVKTILKGYWDLFRLDHGLMVGLGVLIGAFSSGFIGVASNLAAGFLIALLLEMGTFALNDYFDYEIDRRNERFDRPLVRGDLSRRAAFISFFFTSCLALLLTSTLNVGAKIFTYIVFILAVLYDWKLKRVKCIGNIYVAFTMAAPFIFGSLLTTGGLKSTPLLFSFMAFLAGLGREVMKDVLDIRGDAMLGVASIPQLVGRGKSLKLAAVLNIMAILLSPLPLLLPSSPCYLDALYGVPVSVTDLILFYIAVLLFKGAGDDALKALRKLSLLAFSMALIGFLLGSIC